MYKYGPREPDCLNGRDEKIKINKEIQKLSLFLSQTIITIDHNTKTNTDTDMEVLNNIVCNVVKQFVLNLAL